MMTNMDIVAVQYLERKRQWKWPKLSETANYYGIAFNEYKLHGSMVDTEITAQIFMKMLHATKSENTTSPPSNTKPVKQI
jgi:DNA polymerase III epsilon subunit-like protein